jgi:hypothetical protein
MGLALVSSVGRWLPPAVTDLTWPVLCGGLFLCASNDKAANRGGLNV